MATIGYGDLKHNYILERMVFVLIIILGSLSSSFFTLTFLKWFRLSEQEEKALSCNFIFKQAIKRLSIKEKIDSIQNEKVQEFVSILMKFKKEKNVSNQNNKDNPIDKLDIEHN